jgi:NitT/TauT family transport system substrate-binding protein
MRRMMAMMAGLGLLLAAPGAGAQETLAVGAVGGANAVVWPHYIAEAKGFYAKQGLKIDLFYSQSNAAVLQALTAGSTKMAIAAGFADPMYAVASGAGVAVVRIDGQVGPYALEGAKGLKSIKDLKGKVVSVDEAKGTTMVYFVKMLAGNGMTRSDVDFIYAGATAARFAALESGAAAAAMITAPQLFRAEDEGFVNLGYDTEYAKDIPFTAELVNRAWAQDHKATAKQFLAAYAEAIDWFEDEKNRTEAIDILEKVTKMSRDDIGKSFDLFHKIDYFDRSNDVSMTKIRNFYNALKELDPSLNLDLDKLVMKLD